MGLWKEKLWTLIKENLEKREEGDSNKEVNISNKTIATKENLKKQQQGANDTGTRISREISHEVVWDYNNWEQYGILQYTTCFWLEKLMSIFRISLDSSPKEYTCAMRIEILLCLGIMSLPLVLPLFIFPVLILQVYGKSSWC